MTQDLENNLSTFINLVAMYIFTNKSIEDDTSLENY